MAGTQRCRVAKCVDSWLVSWSVDGKPRATSTQLAVCEPRTLCPTPVLDGRAPGLVGPRRLYDLGRGPL